MRNISVSKDWLEEEYINKQRSLQEISYDLKISPPTLYNILCSYGINVRTNQYAKKNLSITKEWLEEEYINKQRSTSDIAKECNCAYNTINRRLREYGLCVRTNSEHKWKNLTGKIFGKWNVLEEVKFDSTMTHSNKWKCHCTGCQNIKYISGTSLLNGMSEGCLDCSIAKNKFEKHIIYSEYWCSAKNSAVKRNIDFCISKDDAAELYLKQDRKCALTGIRLNMADNHIDFRDGKQTASLDRIDSMKIYTLDNVQWVHKTINIMKWDIPNEEFIKWCNLVSKHLPMEIEEQKEIPVVLADNENESEWDDPLWKTISKKFKNVNYPEIF